jgi:hypothetical protein
MMLFLFISLCVICKRHVNRRRADGTMAKKKGQKDKLRSPNITYKTKDRITRTPLKSGGGQIKPPLGYDVISFYKLMCDMQETYFVNLECTLTYHSVT